MRTVFRLWMTMALVWLLLGTSFTLQASAALNQGYEPIKASDLAAANQKEGSIRRVKLLQESYTRGEVSQAEFASAWAAVTKQHYGTVSAALSDDTTWFDLTWDVDMSQAAVLDLHMYRSSTWLEGYTSGDWWHFTAADGYTGSGSSRQIRRVDPNSVNLNGYGYHWDSLTKMPNALQGRGFVW